MELLERIKRLLDLVEEYIQYQDVLYKVLQAHTVQEAWTPTNAPSLFAKVLID